MKLKSFGCSFIYGSDLSDCPHDVGVNHPPPSQLTWPALIAKNLGFEYSCHAWPGTGNLRILERIMHESIDSESSVFIISWTWIDRFDYIWLTDRPWIDKGWKSIMPNDPGDFAREYYAVYHNQIKDQITSVIYINQAIQLLQEQKIPFVMTYQDNLILDHQYHNHSGLYKMQENISPHMTLFDGMTFLEWSKSKKFPISKNFHPLDLAHAKAADIVMPIIERMI